MQQYPVYRKYKGLNVWFKIISDRSFIELKKLGERWIKHEVEAKQYPEIVLIQDMLRCADDRWEPMSADLFEEILNKSKPKNE